jgi:hypothetical protein
MMDKLMPVLLMAFFAYAAAAAARFRAQPMSRLGAALILAGIAAASVARGDSHLLTWRCPVQCRECVFRDIGRKGRRR